MTERTIQHILVTTGLTEAELAELLEGGAVGAEREAALRVTLARHPEVAKFFAGVRTDRAAMRVLDQSVRAPAGLLEAVEIRIDQEALRTLTEPATSGMIPVGAAVTRIERRNPIAVLVEQVWVRRMATAAGLALAIGVGAWGTFVGIQNWPRGGGLPTDGGAGTIARNDPADVPDGAAPDTNLGDMTIAAAEASRAPYTALAMVSPAEGPGIAADGTVFSEAELVSLASAGRLAIVISGDTRAIPGRIDRLASQGRGFGVASVSQETVGASMSPLAAAMTREAGIPRSEWAGALRDPWSARGGGAGISTSRRFMSISAGADAASLHSVLAACGVLGEGSGVPGRTVRIIVLDEAVESPVATDAMSVLWWSASPAKWARTTTVPVVIEE